LKSLVSQRTEKVLSFFLTAGVLLVVQISVGRLFQAAGPATLNTHSTNFNDVCGMSKALLSADCRPAGPYFEYADLTTTFMTL